MEKKSVRFNYFLKRAPLLCLFLFLSACNPFAGKSPSTSGAANASPTASSTPISSVMAVKILFRTTGGSFTGTMPATGSTPGIGNGFQAVTYFDTTTTALSTKPTWISFAEVSISGSSNTASMKVNGSSRTVQSTNADCSRFSGAGGTVANFQSTTTGLFQISESDCIDTASATTDGMGGINSDPVYIRIKLNRAAMGAGENVLAVVEYLPSSLYSNAQQNPARCFVSQQFKPEYCNDQIWNSYLLKSTLPEATVNAFALFIPPSYPQTTNNISASVALAGNTGMLGKSALMSKEIVLPISLDGSLDVFQISRGKMNPNLTQALIGAYCNPVVAWPPAAGGTPLCSGVIFHSITLYRI